MAGGGCAWCSGWTEYDPDYLADRCLNCCRLYYTTAPQPQVPRQAPRGTQSQPSPETVEVRRLIVSALTTLGRPATIQELRQLLAGTRGANPQYLAGIIGRMPEVEKVSWGVWKLREDWIFKSDYL